MVDLPTTHTVRRPQANGYGAAIDDLLVRLAAAPNRQLVTETAEMQVPRVQTEATPEDMQPSFGDVHSQESWIGGEGVFQRFRAGRERDATRFWKSQGIDTSPTDEDSPEELRLLTDTERIDEDVAHARIAHDGTTLWAAGTTVLRKTMDVLADTPSFADDDPHDGETAVEVEDVTTLGSIPYAALSTNGIHRDDSGWSHWSDVEARRIWSILDRIIASDGTTLYEADAGAASLTLYTLPSGHSWTGVVDADGALAACATNGFIYVFTLNDSSELEISGQSKMEGETPRALAARSDAVWVATQDGDDARLWQADGAGLENLQLLREWTDTDVREMTVSRDRLVIGLRHGDDAWTWRLELSTGGLSKAHELGQGLVNGLAVIEGYTIAGVSTDGVWREIDAIVSEGWLIGPLNDFFRSEEKSWVTGWADVAIDLGERVELFYTTDPEAMNDPDHDSWLRLRSFGSTSSGDERALRSGTVARSLAVLVRLYASDEGTNPRVRATAFRSYPGPGDVIVQLPVDVGDQVERHGKRPLTVPGLGSRVSEALREKEHRAATVRVYRTNEQVLGVVEGIATPVPALTPRGSATQMAMVTVRGRRVTDEPISTSGWGAWGAFQWGGASWGGELLEEAS